MNEELIAEVVSDLAELSHPPAESIEARTNSGEMPFYIIPAPPVPGKMAWSIVPW